MYARDRPVVLRRHGCILVHGLPREIEVEIREALQNGLGDEGVGVRSDLPDCQHYALRHDQSEMRTMMLVSVCLMRFLSICAMGELTDDILPHG